MIDRIEIHTHGNALEVCFFYDTHCMDVYSVTDSGEREEIMEFIQQDADPESLLAKIRTVCDLTLH